MVIDPNNIANTGSAGAKSKAPSAEPASGLRQRAPVKAAGDSSDSVSFSAEAQSLAKVESAIASSPDVDSAKVDAIRAQLQSGQYRIDAEALANKILNQDTLV